VFEGLESVVEGVISGGAPEPTWVAVDDGSGRWSVMAAERPVGERSAGVVAAASEQSLLTAQKLGIGGAMWLPPAYLGAMDAFEAANSPPGPIREFDPIVIELLEPGTPIQLVTFADLQFWRVQFGDSALRYVLTELAESVDRPAAILPWPAVVVAAESSTETLEAWRDLAAGRHQRYPNLVMASTVVDPGEPGVLESVYRRLLEGLPLTGDIEERWKEPVHELPSGRQVGWWSSRECDESPSDVLWCAVPASVHESRCRWAVQAGDDTINLREALISSEVAESSDVSAIRMPGWTASGLGSGTPSGLLALRLAEAASRLDVPLWIPSVEQESLRFVLSLPGTTWVDGPAVPRQDV
jgi:hypothetical protein